MELFEKGTEVYIYFLSTVEKGGMLGAKRRRRWPLSPQNDLKIPARCDKDAGMTCTLENDLIS